MTDRRQIREATRIFILCVFWYLISSSNNVIGKLVLNEFPYPMTLTMVQLLSISLYSGPLLKCWNIRPGLQSSFSKDYYWKLIIPLAFGKFLSSVFSHISIWKVPVSFAHTGLFISDSNHHGSGGSYRYRNILRSGRNVECIDSDVRFQPPKYF
ncbi:putative Solute carrier family 35 member E1 [Daphnia magna]|uniref:Putative Solute carrier family 35 member E1 n=1 Tax=Daphnia magna TaxID=35525 RepID=A0A162QWU5_9CRUS|nr:putative Solute carrier family 35 member E1 [Daphnia magna]